MKFATWQIVGAVVLGSVLGGMFGGMVAARWIAGPEVANDGPRVLVFSREQLRHRLIELYQEGDPSVLLDPELTEKIDSILDRAHQDTGAVILSGNSYLRAPEQADITEDVLQILLAMKHHESADTP